MVTIGSLWLPILLSTIAVWLISAFFWTASPHHKTDFKVLPDQDDFLDKLRAKSLAAGQYFFPYSADPKEMQSPEFKAKMEQGPVGLLSVFPGNPNMGKAMGLSGLFYLFVSAGVAYLATRTLAPGADYLSVFRIAGTISFFAYGLGHLPEAIWFGTPASRAWKTVGDALVYGLVTAGFFGAFWP